MSDPLPARPVKGPAPEALVADDGSIVLGTWNDIPGKANLIDAERPFHYALPHFLKRLRLKEWRAIQAGDEDWFLCAVLYDAKFISMASIDLWDRKNKKKAGFRRMFPGSRFSLPQNFGLSEIHANAGGDQLSIRVDPEKGFLGIKASSRSKIPGEGAKFRDDTLNLDLKFDLSAGACSPFSVCLPLGLNRAMYSTKILMPCSGTLFSAGHEHRFDPMSALGILDDHKGYYPYRLHYDWITGFGMDASGQRAGFNLTDNQVKDQARYNENRLWIGNEIYPLPRSR